MFGLFKVTITPTNVTWEFEKTIGKDGFEATRNAKKIPHIEFGGNSVGSIPVAGHGRHTMDEKDAIGMSKDDIEIVRLKTTDNTLYQVSDITALQTNPPKFYVLPDYETIVPLKITNIPKKEVYGLFAVNLEEDKAEWTFIKEVGTLDNLLNYVLTLDTDEYVNAGYGSRAAVGHGHHCVDENNDFIYADDLERYRIKMKDGRLYQISAMSFFEQEKPYPIFYNLPNEKVVPLYISIKGHILPRRIDWVQEYIDTI